VTRGNQHRTITAITDPTDQPKDPETADGTRAGLDVSRSGTGAHAWIFFTGPVPAQTARCLGTGLLREAMAPRGRMSQFGTRAACRRPHHG
jgi:hypothetical protein